MIPTFTRTPTKDPVIEEVQDNIQEFTSILATNALLDGSYVDAHPDGTDIILDNATTVSVAHKLGRTPIGFIVTWADAAYTPYLVSTGGVLWDNTFAYMRSSDPGAGSQFKFWFF